ncbi:MAG: Ig-like domain-containing protein, partial [Marinobacter sp.]
MKQFKTLALIPAMLLAACGGSDEQEIKQSVKDSNQSVSLVYSYPMDGQADVSPKADIVLRFSHAIADDDATLAQKIQVDSSAGSPAFTVTKIDGGKSLKLEIAEGQTLASRETYSITFNEPLLTESGREINTPNAVGEPGIQFDTRGEFSGVAELAQTSDDFAVAWQVPANGTAFEAANFSTFRLALTHPVHPEWQKHGGSIELLDKNGAAVPATVLVKGNRITVDPCVTDDPKECGSKDDILNAGQEYTLKLNNLASLTNGPDGARLSKSFSFTPRATGPTVVLQQSAIDSDNGAIRSVLNGERINGVTLNSVLQGKAGPSQQTGNMFAELAYAPSFKADEALPLRIPKGSVLTSTSLDVLVGGLVPVTEARPDGEPAGPLQTTGDIKVTMISDASGYMSPNPYTDDLNAPRHITLFMDISMNTEEAQPNASLSQDLMGVELRGIALVQDGVLTIDALGMVEPNLLGQEYTDSTIAFHLQAATDVDSVLDAEVLREFDNTAPNLVSWMPGDKDNAVPKTRQDMQRPGDPVILFFDEPLDEASVSRNVSLTADNGETSSSIAFAYNLDGTTLALNPEGGLKHGVTYSLNFSGVTDLAGNAGSYGELTFALPQLDDGNGTVEQRSPFALTTYPGYPCVTEPSSQSLADNNHGYCKDAAGDELPKDGEGNAQSRDQLPVTTLPEDRPIVVVFSQSMDLESIRLNDTFKVEKANEDGTSAGIVEGRLEKNNQRIRFYPDEKWDSTGNTLYKYTLVTDNFGDPETEEGKTAADCSRVICGENEQAFTASLLMSPTANGGESLEIFFRGEQSVNSVFTPLRNLPIRDANSNYIIDSFETFEFEDVANPETAPLKLKTPPNAAGLKMNGNATVLGDGGGESRNARVGCSYEEELECWDKKFIYQTYGLNTEVIGPEIDPETGEKTGALRVLLYPTMLVTSEATVWYKLVAAPSESKTGPQILRMRYEEPTEDNPLGLIEGRIVEGEDG